MIVRPTVLKKIADNLCWMCEHGMVRCASGVVAVNGKELLDDGAIFIDMAGHVRITSRSMGVLNRKTSTVILLQVLRALEHYGELRFNGNITYPVKFRRMTIEMLSNDGLVEIDGATVRLTAAGKVRLMGGMKQIVVSVPAHLVDAVNAAIREVLDNA